jgi:hypothetical protein
MKTVLCLLLTSSVAFGVVLADATYQVPSGEWRSLHFPVTAVPSRVACRFEVQSQPGAARAVLLSREDLERFASHQPYGYLTATGEQSRGAFQFDLRQTGTFAVLLINSGAAKAASPIRFFASLGPVPQPPAPAAAPLSPARKLATIAMSIGVFLVLLTWSGSRLLKAMRRGSHFG